MSDLAAAIEGDGRAFERLVVPYRRELLVHAYRLLGSSSDAEDVLQEALVAAWRGLGGLRTADALRSWLYRVTTNAALRFAERRGPRMLSWDAGTAADPGRELAAPEPGPWVEPFRDPDPARAAERREHIELAWIAALQLMPANQRAVLVLKDVLGFGARDIAELLGTSVASVNSALQRARTAAADGNGRATDGPSPADREAVRRFTAAFVAGDVDGLVELLSDDVRFTMPPLPAWFQGAGDVGRFLTDRVLATPWEVVPLGEVNGHPALLGMQWQDGRYRPGAVMVLHIHAGRIRWLATFVDPDLVRRFVDPPEPAIAPTAD